MSLIRILYLEQQSNIVRCLCSLKFGKSLFSRKFFSFIFRSKMIVDTAKKGKKILLKVSLVKSHSSICKLLVDFPAAAINYVYSSLWSLVKDFSPLRELQGLEMYYKMNEHPIRENTSSKYKKMKNIKLLRSLT